MSAVRAGERPLWQVLASPKMLAIAALAASSGFPNQLTEGALQGWLKDTGATNTTIGIMSYVAFPYLLKFLWAPLIDRYPLPFLGRRRGWILLMQIALALALGALALQDPRASLLPISVCAAAVVFFSATQDIAIDAWRADVSLPEERGPAAAATNFGYRLFSYLALAVALVIAEYFGWRTAFTGLALAMLLFCIATLRAPGTHNTYRPRTLGESVIEPLRELLSTPNALALIAVVLLFKVGDAFANKLFTPFVMDVGFSKAQIGTLVKPLFTAGSLAGVALGGIVMVRLGLLRSMLSFGVLQALSNLLYCLMAVSAKSYVLMGLAVFVEHVAAAMGNIALVALIMAMCDRRYSAFQYALLSALALLPRYSLGYPAGWIADHAGWFLYFVASFALGLPGLAMVWFNRRHIVQLDRPPGAPA
ncbi:MAG TPA: MFS transporter [Steroidobacteraceae bacterium]|nr:MFS transporter [Steroidobacteraceae bacterium]